VKITVYRNAHDLASALAEDVADRLSAKPTLVIGLPTGRTPLGFYREIVRLAREGRADFSRATTFNLDEFLGARPEHATSYRQYMERHFFGQINIDPGRVHVLDGGASDARVECERYEAAISEAGGIDVQILGIGSNGHIGFNEPAASLNARTHVARLRPETRRANAAMFGGDASRVPARALSMGMATILGARSIVLMAIGSGKARQVEGAIHGPLTTRLPASFLQIHTDVRVMLDRAAAARLRPGRRGTCAP
jgi:glucosamine-6-phosphate deaminase